MVESGLAPENTFVRLLQENSVNAQQLRSGNRPDIAIAGYLPPSELIYNILGLSVPAQAPLQPVVPVEGPTLLPPRPQTPASISRSPSQAELRQNPQAPIKHTGVGFDPAENSPSHQVPTPDPLESSSRFDEVSPFP